MHAESRYAARIGPAIPVKKSTIPQSTVGYLFGRRIRRGTERRLCMWRQKIGDKFDTLGGGKAWPMQAGGPFQWVRPLVHLKHTTINLGSTGWGRNWPGDREAAAFVVCIFLEFWPAVFFYGIIKLQPGGRI